MDGMIFAAGLGTRLRPLTDDRPKALVRLGEKTLLEHVIGKMSESGIQRIVVNVHHYAGQVEDFLSRHSFPGCRILVSDERECLLDTGGGLRKARPLFTPGQPVLIHNVDIFSDVDLKQLMAVHNSRKDYATLVTAPAGKGRGLRFDGNGRLTGWENQRTGEQKKVNERFDISRLYNFCGIQIVSSEFLQQMQGTVVFSIIDEYLMQARQREIRMFFYEGNFIDLGTPEALRQASKYICL